MKTREVSLLRMGGGGIRADDKSVCSNRVTEDLLTWLLLRQRCDWRLGIRGPVCTGVASLITVLSPHRGGRGSFSLCSERSLLPHACRSSGVLEKGGGGIRAFFGPTDMKSHQDRNEDFINLHGCSVSAEQFVFRDVCTVSAPHLYTSVCPVLALPRGT